MAYVHFLKMLNIFFLSSFCTLSDLSRCSPSASHYLQHPPIICFTNLLPPPSPLLASPLILKLDHPSAAPICVNSAYEDTSLWAYIINAALTIAKLYLFMYLQIHISLKVSVYTKAHSSKSTNVSLVHQETLHHFFQTVTEMAARWNN